MAGTFRLESLKQVEDDVEAACLGLLDRKGWYHVRCHCGTFRSADLKRWLKGEPKGTPDYFCGHELHPAFFMETKAPGEQPSTVQILRMAHISGRYGYRIPCIVVHSINELADFLSEHERKTGRHSVNTTRDARAALETDPLETNHHDPPEKGPSDEQHNKP